MSIDRILSNPSHENREDMRSSHREIPISIVVPQNPEESVRRSVRRERDQENPAVVRNDTNTTWQAPRHPPRQPLTWGEHRHLRQQIALWEEQGQLRRQLVLLGDWISPNTFQTYLMPQQVNWSGNKSRRESSNKETSVSHSLPELIEVEDDFENVGRVPEGPQGE